MFRLPIALAVGVMLATGLCACGNPVIEITSVPTHGSLGYLHGKVTGVADPQNYKVATYVQPEGAGWWTKPYSDPPESRMVPVSLDGSFQVNVTTGGPSSSDPQTTLYCVNLMPAGAAPPPLADGLPYQPESPLFIATATHERYARTMEFSGRTWGVKESPIPVGPGPNRFSQEPADIWVAPDSKLHLTVRQRGSNWFGTEVILTESLGYGRYLVQTSSRVDALDSRAIFGGFLWDAFGEPGPHDGRRNREIDLFEYAVWSDPPRPPENAQFVVQPWDTPGNRHQFELPDLSGNADLTSILTWEEGRLHFLLLRGHHGFFDYSVADIIEEWEYVQDPSLNHWVPDPERERLRFNMYLRDGLNPVGDGALEVVVDRFAFVVPEPSTPGDANSDGKVDDQDASILAANWRRMSDATWEQGDFNGDHNVDDLDASILAANWLAGTSSAAVPEPATVVLLLSALLTLAMLGARRGK